MSVRLPFYTNSTLNRSTIGIVNIGTTHSLKWPQLWVQLLLTAPYSFHSSPSSFRFWHYCRTDPLFFLISYPTFQFLRFPIFRTVTLWPVVSLPFRNIFHSMWVPLSLVRLQNRATILTQLRLVDTSLLCSQNFIPIPNQSTQERSRHFAGKTHPTHNEHTLRNSSSFLN